MKFYLAVFIFLFLHIKGFAQSHSIHYVDKKIYGNVGVWKTNADESVSGIIPLQFNKSELSASVFG